MTKIGVQTISPLLVRPRDAWRMLGCGQTRLYQLLNAGELDSFAAGGARMIVVESIHRYIARNLAAPPAYARKPIHEKGQPYPKRADKQTRRRQHSNQGASK